MFHHQKTICKFTVVVKRCIFSRFDLNHEVILYVTTVMWYMQLNKNYLGVKKCDANNKKRHCKYAQPKTLIHTYHLKPRSHLTKIFYNGL